MTIFIAYLTPPSPLSLSLSSPSPLSQTKCGPFNANVELRTRLDESFVSKPEDFYHRGNEKLVGRCQEAAVNNHGQQHMID